MAELGSVSGRRGEAGGHGNGERWRRLRSGALGEERTREEGEREGGEKDRGGCVASFQASRRGGERQAGREGGGVAERVAADGCGAGTHLLGRGGEDDRGAGGLGRLLAGPACCCWAAQGRATGKHR